MRDTQYVAGSYPGGSRKAADADYRDISALTVVVSGEDRAGRSTNLDIRTVRRGRRSTALAKVQPKDQREQVDYRNIQLRENASEIDYRKISYRTGQGPVKTSDPYGGLVGGGGNRRRGGGRCKRDEAEKKRQHQHLVIQMVIHK